MNLDILKEAGNYHIEITKSLQNILKPNIKYIDVCTFIESEIKNICKKDNIEAGSAFPVGVSVNNIICHDSAYHDDKRVIKKNDVFKIDFGVHINGMIIDSAKTYSFNKKYDSLINATKEATEKAIKLSGVDALLSDLSSNIEEIIESHELDINGKIHPIKAVGCLGGHNILPYKIHGGKIIPSKKNPYSYDRMEENEVYAIETFATTSLGQLFIPDIPVTHFTINDQNSKKLPILKSSEKMLKYIQNNKKTLPFSERWIYNYDNDYKLYIDNLIKKDYVKTYPPLADNEESYTSQHEHSIYIKEDGVVVLSQ